MPHRMAPDQGLKKKEKKGTKEKKGNKKRGGIKTNE